MVDYCGAWCYGDTPVVSRSCGVFAFLVLASWWCGYSCAVSRLCGFVLLLVLVCFSGGAFADSGSYWHRNGDPAGAPTSVSSTADGSCRLAMGVRAAADPGSVYVYGQTTDFGNTAGCQWTRNGQFDAAQGSVALASYNCSSGQFWNGSSCVANNCPAAGTSAKPVGWNQTGFGSEGLGVSKQQIGGCEVDVGPMSCNGGLCVASPRYTGLPGQSGQPTIVPTFTGPSGGGSCAGGSHVDFVTGMSICVPDSTSPGDLPCGSGEVRGSFNGLSMCLPGAGPSGTSSSTGTVTKTNADGSTTSSTTTNACTGAGSCTSTTTSGGTGVPASGGAPGSGAPLPTTSVSETQDKPTFCQSHPKDVACLAKENFASFGDCPSPPSCSGDAILCAIAGQTYQHHCLQVAESKVMHDDARTTRGQAVMDGADPLAATLPTVAHATVVNVASSLDQTAFLGGGQCLADYQRTVMGKSLVVPFSELCGGLGYLRWGLLVVCGIISFYIVAGVVRGGESS